MFIIQVAQKIGKQLLTKDTDKHSWTAKFYGLNTSISGCISATLAFPAFTVQLGQNFKQDGELKISQFISMTCFHLSASNILVSDDTY